MRMVLNKVNINNKYNKKIKHNNYKEVKLLVIL